MLEDNWKRLIKQVVRKYLPDERYRVFVFGSRAQGRNRKWSDVDVGISGPIEIDFAVMAAIKEDLANSDIPYRCDVVDFGAVKSQFREIAAKHASYL